MWNNIYKYLTAILSGIIAYTVDALLNFPLERAINQVNFGLIIALTSLYYKNEKV